VRPDQVSWYRGQVVEPSIRPAGTEVVDGIELTKKEWGIQNVAILEEVQSKRVQRARELGVTKEPDNPHAQLISLQREADVLDKERQDLERELGLDRWEPTDENSRYIPDDVHFGAIKEDIDPLKLEGIAREKAARLDKLRIQIDLLQHEINNLEHVSDSAPVPWAPHMDTWWEPALKGFLREAAEKLEPDTEGNIRVTWTPGSEQAERYNARKYVDKLEWNRYESRSPENARKARLSRYLEDRIAPDPDGPSKWDVTAYFKEGSYVRVKTFNGLTEKKLSETFGKTAAARITQDTDTMGSFDTRELPIGGQWAVKLYGDSLENIQRLWPEHPELQEYAWKESGNKATVPAWLEKYAKAWGGRIELEPKAKPEWTDEVDLAHYGFTPESMGEIVARNQGERPGQPHLVIPEKMQQMLLKQGQPHFGRKLPDLPKGARPGIRNRITTEEQAALAEERLSKKFRTTVNPLTGERIPDPSKKEGGFLGRRKPELDPRVQTDIAGRDKGDTAGMGVFVRSPYRWMFSRGDARMEEVANHLFDAQTREHDYTVAWGRRFSAIIEHLQTATLGREPRSVFGKKADQEAMKQTFSEFIDLVEKDFKVDSGRQDAQGRPIMVDNPDRRSPNPLIQRALEEHDQLANEFKDYLIDSYEARGIEIQDPENWGITEQGYFRHLFPGEDNIFMDGEYQGTGETYLDAIVKANALIQANPNANIEIKRRPIQFVDPSLRVSTRSFERLVSKLTGTIQADGYQTVRPNQIREDLVGTVGKKENISKFFAAALKREGYTGYIKDYEQVMRAHYFQLARSQELSKLKKNLQPVIEDLQRSGRYGDVEAIERQMSDLWGRPLSYEKFFGGLIRQHPRLREKITNPDLGLEMMVRKIAGWHNIAKLRYNPKAIFVNRIQPLRTLWPYLTTKDVFEVVKRMRDPQWKQAMTELGVMSGAVKLETGGSRVEGFGPKEFLKDPFTYVSGSNRALGYTAGIIFAERLGLGEFNAHKLGMKWAGQAEFDNSKWNSPRFLRHSLGQLFGQYKGFFVKDLENTIDVWSGNSDYKQNFLQLPPEGSLSRVPRIGKWFAGTAVAGGTRAALSPIPWLGTAAGYSMYLIGASLIKASTGVSDKDAKFYSSMMFLGPPAGAGLDISASVTPIDDPPGITAWEKVGRFALGPTVTGLYDLGRGVKQVVAPGSREKRPVSERIFNTATKISPYARMGQRAYQLGQDVVRGKPQYMTIDQHRVRLTRKQEAAGVFGVSPANQTLYYEEKEATGKSPLSSEAPNLFGNPNRGLLTPFKPMPKRR
jgi:hypothetical protein